jgi:hypothetical protein
LAGELLVRVTPDRIVVGKVIADRSRGPMWAMDYD